jgi:hypothetical protein
MTRPESSPIREEWASKWDVTPDDTPETIIDRVLRFAEAGAGEFDLLTPVGTRQITAFFGGILTESSKADNGDTLITIHAGDPYNGSRFRAARNRVAGWDVFTDAGVLAGRARSLSAAKTVAKRHAVDTRPDFEGRMSPKLTQVWREKLPVPRSSAGARPTQGIADLWFLEVDVIPWAVREGGPCRGRLDRSLREMIAQAAR